MLTLVKHLNVFAEKVLLEKGVKSGIHVCLILAKMRDSVQFQAQASTVLVLLAGKGKDVKSPTNAILIRA